LGDPRCAQRLDDDSFLQTASGAAQIGVVFDSDREAPIEAINAVTSMPAGKPFRRRRRLVLVAVFLLTLSLGASLVSVWRDRQPVYGGRPLTEWAADLTASAPERSAAAREAVRVLGPRAVPTLIRLVRQPDPVLARPLLKVAARCSPAAHETLSRWLRLGPHREARSQAMLALRHLGPVAEPAVPTLARIVNRPPDELRVQDWMQATYALGRMGPAAVAPLLDAFTNAPAGLRAHPLLALAEVGPGAAEAIPVVLAVFANQPEADWSALGAFLCAAGGAATLPHFYGYLDSPESTLRFKAAEVLYRMAECSSEVRDALTAAGGAQSPRVRFEVVKALGRLKPTRGAVARVMLQALDAPDEALRLEGARWLEERLSPAALGYLLANESPEVQARARRLREAAGGLPWSVR